MSPLAIDLDNILRSVHPHTALLLERAVRDSLALAQRRHESEAGVDYLGYPVGYFEATSGSFAHDLLDVPPDVP
jgi:hypothetical protein